MPRTIISEGFENGLTEFNEWKNTKGAMLVPKAHIVPTPSDQVGFTSNHVLNIPYDIGEPAPVGERIGPADCNRFIQWMMKSENLHHFSVSGKFSLAKREGDVLTAQRKLFYVWGFPALLGKGGWHIVLSARGGVPDKKNPGQDTPIGLDLSTSPYGIDAGGAGAAKALNCIQYNKAHHLEMRVKLNTVENGIALPDGYIDVLLDGKSVIRRDNLSYRRGPQPLGICRVGAQINDGSTTPDGRGPRHEDRYWDDIKIVALD